MAVSDFINQALADELTAAYKGERLSQARLVEATGINATTMQRLMAGKSEFDVTQLALLAAVIGVPPNVLMARAEGRAERMSSDAATNDLQRKRSEKEAEARAMTPDQLAEVERHAAMRSEEMDTDESDPA